VFKDLELVEQLGSGMKRIMEVYDESIFEFTPNFMFVTFPFEQGFNESDGLNADLKSNLKSNHETLNCTLTEAEILTFLNENPMANQKEIAAAVSKSINTIKIATVHLQELGLLRRDGAKKKGQWIVIEKQEN